MAVNALPRQNDPRFRPTSADQFTAFRAGLLDAFANGTTESFVKRLEAALGKVLDFGSAELKTEWPIMLPRATFEKAVGPLVYKKYSETSVTSSPSAWQDGISEDKRKHLAPGPSFLRDGNNATSWAQAAVEAVELQLVTAYLAGTTGTHAFDNASFFSAVDAVTKYINPKGGTRKYTNHKALTLKKSNPIAFIESLESHFEGIPSLGEKGYLKLEVAATLSGTVAHKILRDVEEQNDLTITIINGAATEEKKIKNRWAGRFANLMSLDMPADKMLVFAKGPTAGVPHVVHSLIGTEELAGGEFMAPVQWQAITGTWMQPLITMLGLDSEHCKKHSEILVQALLDFDVTLMCPWSVLLVDLTVE
jgi:hypothetical protein